MSKVFDKTGWPILPGDYVKFATHKGRVTKVGNKFATFISLDGCRTMRTCLHSNLEVIPSPHWSRWRTADFNKSRRAVESFKKRMIRQRKRELKPIFRKYRRLCKMGRYKPTSMERVND